MGQHESEAAAAALMEWDPQAFGLGVPDMDEVHAQFIEQVNRLDTAPNREFAVLFTRLLEHTRAHFEKEENRMRQSGFPATAEHCNEHRRVLGELVQISKQVNKGLVSFGRMYVREGLPGWFRLHAATMDSALAAHWKQYTAGREADQL